MPDKMEYKNLGKSGIKVSPVCLGTMTFGREADEEFDIVDDFVSAAAEMNVTPAQSARDRALRGIRRPIHFLASLEFSE